jgi:hypothetical protein
MGDVYWIAATVVLTVALMAALCVAIPGAYHRSAWRSLRRQRVVLAIETGDGPRTIRAILWERRGQLYVLRDAAVYLGGDDLATPMDGEVVVERARVLWVQVIR